MHVTFDGQLGAPVQPGVTTTRYALFHAYSTSSKLETFQPLLGCIPVQGGGGRSTVSARVTPPGPNLDVRSSIVVIGPGNVKFARIACTSSENLVDAWHAVAFRTKSPPSRATAGLVTAKHVVVGNKVVVTASATDALSLDARAIVQAGAECAPTS